jgi:nucleoside phosphorylase
MIVDVEQGIEISWVDVVVICALPVEFRALKETLTPHTKFETDAGLGLDHFLALGGSGLTVLVVRLPEPGAGNVVSGIVTSLLIARYDPWLLISFGIAGTLDTDEVKALDVLYSKVVFYLDLRKETRDKETEEARVVLKRIVPRETPMPLLRLLRRMEGDGYHLHEVDIVTGEAVVKDEKAQLRQIAGNAIADAKAVEMESFGVFHAAHVDKEFLTRTDRLCVAIKCISDNADEDKSNEHHLPAAYNAARFLSAILQEPNLAVLRGNSGVDRRPRPLQPFIRLRPRDVLTQVDSFSDIVQTITRSDWDDSTLHAVHMHCKCPRVFYHWRLTGLGLHWIELKFLLVLRRLADAGYPVECLITDEIIRMPHVQLTKTTVPEARRVTQRIVDALLPPSPDSAASFYSKIRESEDTLSRYARSAGYWSEIRRKLGGLGRIPGMTNADSQLSQEFNEWLKYIAWRVRREGACIVFYFCDRDIYSLLWRFSGLLPSLIPTGDIKLAGEWGKFKSPGSDLYLVPPDYPILLQWLSVTSDPAVLAEFWTHLTAQEGLAEAALIEKRRAWARNDIAASIPWGSEPRWIEGFQAQEERTPEYYKGAILLELAWLNKTFFSSFREGPVG